MNTIQEDIKQAKSHWKQFHTDADVIGEGIKKVKPLRIIGVHGKAGSGKTTMCELITKIIGRNCKIISFADPLKRIALSLGWEGEKDEKGRRLLQLLGTEVGRGCVAEDIWLRHYTMQLFENRKEEIIFTDDMRFENEIALIKEYGGTTVNLKGRSDIAKGASGHSSEKQMPDDEFDFTINNDGDMGKFTKSITTMLKELKWIS